MLAEPVASVRLDSGEIVLMKAADIVDPAVVSVVPVSVV